MKTEPTNEPITCAISSKSLNLEPELQNQEEDENIPRNNNNDAKKFSGGIKGGIIAGIVIVSCLVLFGVAATIALIKCNKVIFHIIIK